MLHFNSSVNGYNLGKLLSMRGILKKAEYVACRDASYHVIQESRGTIGQFLDVNYLVMICRHYSLIQLCSGMVDKTRLSIQNGEVSP